MAPQLAALPWYGAGETPLEEPLVVSGIVLTRKEVPAGLGVGPGLQSAGRAFYECFEEPLAKASSKGRKDEESPSPRGDEKTETERERAFREKREKKQRDSKGKDGGLLKISEELKGHDLYELLEVEPGASPEDLKKSYRKLVLVHHPDKMADPTEAQKQHFLLIQEAYEIVGDADKRRRYESTLDFDEYIPTGFGKGRLADADFFETFGPVFKRNARWSVRNKVPELGDESTPIEAVKDFYDFWYEFETWRDPLAMAEKEEMELHNLEEAECREERRWMERENGKVAKKLAAAERERIMDLVKASEKNDPRMIQYKEEQWQQKQAEKERKAAVLRAVQEKKEAEARAKAEAEEVKRKAEEAIRLEEKKKREEAKNALKAARQRLRTLHKSSAAMVRHNVHADQLQEVCLRLDTEELNAFCGQLEAKIAKVANDSFGDVISMLHAEIEKCGATPIVDPRVDPSGKDSNDTTSCGDSDMETSEVDASPPAPARELTPEELEAERLRRLAEEAAERERQEKRAEELRKKRELQRKEEERRLAALRKMEKKETEAAKKQEAKVQKKQEQEAKQAEEQRTKALQQAEEQRAAALAEEQERRQQHEDQLVQRAFEADRSKRMAVLEAYEEGLLDAALRGTLLQEGTETPNLKLAAALKRIAAQLPPPATSKAEAADQARRELEELCVDACLGCLVAEGGAGAAPTDARARLAQAVAVAVRPPASTPELSKEAKASVKKVRNRVRSSVISLLKSMQPAAPAAPPAAAAPAGKVVASATAPKPEAVKAGTELLVAEEGTLFESLTSYEDLGVVAAGKLLVASGVPQEVEGFHMVPIKPKGAVELRILRAVAAPEPAGGKPAKGGAKAAKGSTAPSKASAKVAEPALDGRLLDFVRLAAAGPTTTEEAENDFLQACLGGFDPQDALAEASAVKAKVDSAESETAKAPAAGKAGKKAKATKGGDEDLDALLEEFGMANQGASKSKKKGKK